MYCRNCANQLDDKAVACPKCGMNPHSDKKYCNGCGVETNENQIMCVKCGISLDKKASTQSSGEDKTVSILSYCTLVGFIIAIVMHSSAKTKSGTYHLRQAMGIHCLTMVFVLLYMIILSANPFLILDIYWLLALLNLGFLTLFIFGIINAVNNEEKPVPLLGGAFEKWFGTMFS